VADSAWLVLREQGAIVEEADDGGDGDDGDEEKFDEKVTLAEQLVHLQDVNIGPGIDPSENGRTRKEIRPGEPEMDLRVLR
jgi:hypothetical protein